MRLALMFSKRFIQIDDVATRFFGLAQNSARISTGRVFRFRLRAKCAWVHGGPARGS
jgi:hypothetical protein